MCRLRRAIVVPRRRSSAIDEASWRDQDPLDRPSLPVAQHLAAVRAGGSTDQIGDGAVERAGEKVCVAAYLALISGSPEPPFRRGPSSRSGLARGAMPDPAAHEGQRTATGR